MKQHILNIPIALTLIRLIGAPVLLPGLLVWLLPYNDAQITLLLGIFFVLLSFTDFLDGYVARRYHQETIVGRALDPLADKFLLVASLVALVALQRIYFYWAILFIVREFFVMGLRALALEYNFSVPVLPLGKIKTASQVVYITMVIFNSPYQTAALTVALLLSYISAYGYYRQFMDTLRRAL